LPDRYEFLHPLMLNTDTFRFVYSPYTYYFGSLVEKNISPNKHQIFSHLKIQSSLQAAINFYRQHLMLLVFL